MSWEPARYQVAGPNGQPYQVAGYTYRGLGLHLVIEPSPKGRRPGLWTLTHLNSGHRVALAQGNVPTAFAAAAAVAELGDWDFDGVAGWRNRDPELPARLVDLVRRTPALKLSTAGGADADQAVAISTARA